jgi:hypothetical protein
VTLDIDTILNSYWRPIFSRRTPVSSRASTIHVKAAYSGRLQGTGYMRMHSKQLADTHWTSIIHLSPKKADDHMCHHSPQCTLFSDRLSGQNFLDSSPPSVADRIESSLYLHRSMSPFKSYFCFHSHQLFLLSTYIWNWQRQVSMGEFQKFNWRAERSFYE